MNVLVVLIPVSLTLGLVGLVGFLWTIRAHQYDDPLGEASRVLLEPQGDLPFEIETSQAALDRTVKEGQGAMGLDLFETDADRRMTR